LQDDAADKSMKQTPARRGEQLGAVEFSAAHVLLFENSTGSKGSTRKAHARRRGDQICAATEVQP